MKKSYITPKWLKIKEMYENGTNGSNKYGTNFPIGGELDKLTIDFVHELGELTQRNGWDYVVEDVKLDLWKERIWCLIENAGLLEEIAWKIEKETKRTNDNWYKIEEELEQEPSDEELKNINISNLF